MSQWTYGDVSRRESLSDEIFDINPLENYVTSTSGSTKVTGVIHSWIQDSIAVNTSQVGTQENSDTTYTNTVPTLSSNQTQIIEYGIKVSKSNQNSDHAGWADEYEREKMKAMKRWGDQYELSAVVGTLATGNGTNAARTMNGIIRYAATALTTQYTNRTLDATLLNERLGIAYDQGQDHDTVLVGRTLKERISGFTANNTRNIGAEGAEIVARVDVYDSDHGRVKIIKHRHVNKAAAGTTNVMVTYIADAVKKGTLDGVHHEDRAQAGYYLNGAVVGEATVEVRNSAAVQFLNGLI